MKTTSVTAMSDFELSYSVNYQRRANATSVSNMKGDSVIAGVGLDAPGISLGINYEQSRSIPNGSVTTHSGSLSVNAGIAPEVYGGKSKNVQIFRFNTRNIFKRLLKKILP